MRWRWRGKGHEPETVGQTIVFCGLPWWYAHQGTLENHGGAVAHALLRAASPLLATLGCPQECGHGTHECVRHDDAAIFIGFRWPILGHGNRPQETMVCPTCFLPPATFPTGND